ncbi:hypothetical protein [Saccharothrix stipae]
MESVTPWRMPLDHAVPTRIRKPWKTGQDKPEKLLDLLVDEAADRLRLSRSLAAALRAETGRDAEAVLRRAGAAQKRYVEHRSVPTAFVVLLWCAAIIAIAVGAGSGVAAAGWQLAGLADASTAQRVVAAVVVPVVVALLFAFGLHIDNLWVVTVGVVLVLGLGVTGYLWTGINWFGWSGAGAFAGVAAALVGVNLTTGGWWLFDNSNWLEWRRDTQRYFDLWAESLYGYGVLATLAEISNVSGSGAWSPAHGQRLDEVVDTDTRGKGADRDRRAEPDQ